MYLAMPNNIGRIRKGLLADIIAVKGNPLESIRNIRNITFVMKDGIIYREAMVDSK